MINDITRLVQQSFKIGWRHGYYDGGEHDCRMFTPTAERALEDARKELSILIQEYKDKK